MAATAEQLQRFQALFRGRETCYGQYRMEPTKKIWTVEKPPQDKHWQAHLSGTGPFLGIVPICQDNHCWWGAIDVDDDRVDHAHVAQQIMEQGLPLIVCRSKSGGAHLYMFLKQATPAQYLMQKLKQWAAALGVARNKDGRPIETFPKQGKLKQQDTGNWINLPYYGGDATNRFAVNLVGGHLSLDEFLAVSEMRAISVNELEVLNGNNPFTDGPPCLETLHQNPYTEGSRNNGLFNVAVFFKLAHPDDWEDLTRQYNEERMDPPCDESAVQACINSLTKQAYTYRCHDMPILDHCKKVKCRKQPFGINGFQRQKQLEQVPVLEGLVKVMTDPPRWRLQLNGTKLIVTTDELLSMTLFRKVAMEKASYMVPMLKQYEWDQLVRGLIEHHTVEEVPEDAGVFGQFQSLVDRFLMKRRQAESKDDLLRGLPVENKTVVLFRSQDLTKFLATQGFKEYPTAGVYTTLRSMGGDHIRLNVKGQKVQCWTLPIPEDEQAEEFDVQVPKVEF